MVSRSLFVSSALLFFLHEVNTLYFQCLKIVNKWRDVMDEHLRCASGDIAANRNQNSRAERGKIKSGQFYLNVCLNYTAETKDRESDLFELINKAKTCVFHHHVSEMNLKGLENHYIVQFSTFSHIEWERHDSTIAVCTAVSRSTFPDGRMLSLSFLFFGLVIGGRGVIKCLKKRNETHMLCNVNVLLT